VALDSRTPSPTGTAAPTQEPTQTPDLPPTETPTPTPEPPPLESAQYFYDGDGTLVKSIVNGEVTYYVSRQFHLRVSGEETRIQKYYPFGGQPIAVRTQANGTDTLNWLLTDHLGSAQVTAAEGGAASGVQRYSAFGEARSRGGEMPTAYQYTGQLSQMEQVGLYHYGARWFDPGLMLFTSPDTLVPDLNNSIDSNRYSYARYNPIRYTDPTGHAVALPVDGGAYDALDKLEDDFARFWNPSSPLITPPEPSMLKSSTWTPPSLGITPVDACSGTNWSVVCKDPTLISSGQVETNVVYPTIPTPGNYDGPYVEEACVHPLLCILVLAADAGNWVTYQTNTPARLAGSYVVGNVTYEVHKNQVGYYLTVPSLGVSNNTNSNISLRSIIVNDVRLIPESQAGVGPGQSVSVAMPAYGYPGSTGMVTIRIDSDVYVSFALVVSFP